MCGLDIGDILTTFIGIQKCDKKDFNTRVNDYYYNLSKNGKSKINIIDLISAIGSITNLWYQINSVLDTPGNNPQTKNLLNHYSAFTLANHFARRADELEYEGSENLKTISSAIYSREIIKARNIAFSYMTRRSMIAMLLDKGFVDYRAIVLEAAETYHEKPTHVFKRLDEGFDFGIINDAEDIITILSTYDEAKKYDKINLKKLDSVVAIPQLFPDTEEEKDLLLDTFDSLTEGCLNGPTKKLVL